MRGVLVSQIGMQPGAVAVVAKTLHGEQALDIREVLLFQTAAAKLEDDQKLDCFRETLTSYLSTLGLEVSVLTGLRNADAVAAPIRDLGRQGATVYYNCSAGLSYFAAKVARLLRGETCVRPMFAEFSTLREVGREWSAPLTDVGFAELLALHRLKHTGRLQNGVVQDLRIRRQDDGEIVFQAPCAYEKGGKLFCLFENVNTRTEARRLIALKRKTHELNGLEPRLTAVTGETSVDVRLRLAEIDSILSSGGAFRQKADDARRQRWFGKNPDKPGTFPPTSSDEACDLKAAYAGGGGSGPPLVVSLGADPSSTIEAIFRHAPAKAWVLYDNTTRHVETLACRMAGNARLLPVGEIRFLPVDPIGAGMDAGTLHPHLGAAGPVHACVTPGTKAQSWMLAQLPDGLATACSLRGRRPVRLDDDEPCETDARDSPLLALAAIRGGILRDEGKPRSYLNARSELLETVGRKVAQVARGQGGGFTFCGRNGRAQGMSWSWAPPPEARLDVTVGTKRGAVRGSFPAADNMDGRWLEELVAWTLLRAGADDIRVGLRWGWPDRPREQRTEIDVVCRWPEPEGGMLGVSVKSYNPDVQRPDRHRDDRRTCRQEIFAMVHECLGRFALPVLVAAIPERSLTIPTMLRGVRERGILEIGVGLLDRPSLVKEAVQASWRALRSTA